LESTQRKVIFFVNGFPETWCIEWRLSELYFIGCIIIKY